MRKQQTDEPIGVWVVLLAVVLGLAVLMYWVSSVFAAEPLRQGKIAAPPVQQQLASRIGAPEEPGWKAHNWYVGGVTGYAWVPDGAGDAAQGGIVAGYLWRSAVTGLGLGVEADYLVRDLGEFSLDDGIASVRGRAGLFVGQGTFVYGTAGVARTYSDQVAGDLRQGLVIGGGVEKDIAANLALRAEVLHYRQGEEYFAWGDEGATAVRGGAVFKF